MFLQDDHKLFLIVYSGTYVHMKRDVGCLHAGLHAWSLSSCLVSI